MCVSRATGLHRCHPTLQGPLQVRGICHINQNLRLDPSLAQSPKEAASGRDIPDSQGIPVPARKCHCTFAPAVPPQALVSPSHSVGHPCKGVREGSSLPMANGHLHRVLRVRGSRVTVGE